MRIQLICLGSLKENYLRRAQDELLGLIAKKTRVSAITVTEIREEPLREMAPAALIQAALRIEGERILEKLPARARIICLDLDGKTASPGFFRGLPGELERTATEDLVFLIGGSNGLDPAIKEKAHHRIAFSGLTFPHQLFRIALLQAIAAELP